MKYSSKRSQTWSGPASRAGLPVAQRLEVSLTVVLTSLTVLLEIASRIQQHMEQHMEQQMEQHMNAHNGATDIDEFFFLSRVCNDGRAESLVVAPCYPSGQVPPRENFPLSTAKGVGWW